MPSDQKITPDDFATWLTAYKGGIKQIVKEWSNLQRKPEASVPRARDQKAQVDSLLPHFHSGSAPRRDGGTKARLVLGRDPGEASVIQVFTDMAPARVDTFIGGELQGRSLV